VVSQRRVVTSDPLTAIWGLGGRTLEKYEPLRDHLAGYTAADQVLLDFGANEELVGPLPRGARRFRQWWANERTPQARAWRAAGWRVVLADPVSERVLFHRLCPRPAPPPAWAAPHVATPERTGSSSRSYLDAVHLPLLVALLTLSIIVGAIGFALRPGTDTPPTTPNTDLTLYVYRQSALGTPAADPTRLVVEETMEQRDAATVRVQLDVFATFATAGPVTWNLLGSRSAAQPFPCADPFEYLGTGQPDPVDSSNGQTTIAGQPATPTVIGDFVGRTSARNAANVLGLYGQAPGVMPAGGLRPVAQVDLCWTTGRPMGFDGEFASASLPGVRAPSMNSGSDLRPELTRNLFFDNPRENLRPVTAQYSLQAGTLPTSTDPYGWHWAAGQANGSVQLTATNIQVAQHETYLGFVSGVLFGIVGGALVLVLQLMVEPIRIRRR
jgi:hypothetical protein